MVLLLYLKRVLMIKVEMRGRDKTREANHISTTFIRRTAENERPLSTTTLVSRTSILLCRIKAKRISLVANLRKNNL